MRSCRRIVLVVGLGVAAGCGQIPPPVAVVAPPPAEAPVPNDELTIVTGAEPQNVQRPDANQPDLTNPDIGFDPDFVKPDLAPDPLAEPVVPVVGTSGVKTK